MPAIDTFEFQLGGLGATVYQRLSFDPMLKTTTLTSVTGDLRNTITMDKEGNITNKTIVVHPRPGKDV